MTIEKALEWCHKNSNAVAVTFHKEDVELYFYDMYVRENTLLEAVEIMIKRINTIEL